MRLERRMVSESLFCMVWQYREMGMSDYSIDRLSGRLKSEDLGFQTAFHLRYAKKFLVFKVKTKGCIVCLC